MAFRDNRPFAFIIYSSFLIFLADARSWDLAVTVDNEVHFFASNGTSIGFVRPRHAVDLSGIAYDDSTHSMFLSDTRNTNLTIFSTNLRNDFDTQQLLNSEKRTHIMGMVYDTQTQNLFWIDFFEQAIKTMHVSSNKSGPGEPLILLKLPNKSPRGISLDVCNRRLYWANSNRSNPSIESSNLDGSNATILISENLYEPLGVAVDHWTAKLYWIDDAEGVSFNIERSNLDGSNRELILRAKHQQPYDIAVDRSTIYWTDWSSKAVWSIKKNASASDKAKKWQSFYYFNRNSDSKSIITRDNIGDVKCGLMRPAEKINTAIIDREHEREERKNNLMTSTEEVESTTVNYLLCLNSGLYDVTTNTCRCESGWDGPHCERSVCDNYCLHGECFVTANGQARCKCSSSFQGPRCEQSICDGYCLNDGYCSIENNEPYCTCKYSHGTRCEIVLGAAEICQTCYTSGIASLNSLNTSSCGCRSGNETLDQVNAFGDDVWGKAIIIIFLSLLGILTTLVAVLSYYVNKLRRRTPIEKCFVPCFEPKLRSCEPNNRKKDDKNTFLDNINSC